MKSLSATPENIASIFGPQKHYIIPEFQRPYSWKEDEITQFFDDITDFYNEHRSGTKSQETYYLGNIVFFKEEDSYVIIDGQQRLTTIALFIKALFSVSITSTALEKCLMKVDPLTSDLLHEIKLESRVIGKDKEELNEIILNDKILNGLLSKNYNKLLYLLRSWISDNKFTSEEVGKFILIILNKILLLPILCETQDDALTIFDTLNNRGRPLSDEDIFKAQIYKNINNEDEKHEFIAEWNEISEYRKEYMRDLFRDLMHIERAKDEVISKEIALRRYYSEKDKNEEVFSDWKYIIDSLKKIHEPLLEYEGGETEQAAELDNLWNSLHHLPHVYCFYPPIVFWAKHAILTEEGSILPKIKFKEFKSLLIRTIKYYFVLAISTNTVNTVKDTTFKVCADIWHNRNYLQHYKEKYKENFDIFQEKLNDYQYKKQRKGLAYLLAVLNENQNQIKFKEVNNEKLDLEHILPQSGGYNNYNGWTKEQYLEHKDSIGNLVLFEKKLNIKASNEFFSKKKEAYKTSKVFEAKELVKKQDWTFRTWKNRQNEKNTALVDFFQKLG